MWCLNVDLVIGFGANLGLALWPRAKPINNNNDGNKLGLSWAKLKVSQRLAKLRVELDELNELNEQDDQYQFDDLLMNILDKYSR